MDPITFAAIVGAGGALTIVGNILGRRARRTADVWVRAAEALDAQISSVSTFGHQEIDGRSSGLRFEVRRYSRSSGKSRVWFTEYRVRFSRSFRFSFDIKSEGVFSELAKMVGLGDITVGDEDFDRLVNVRAGDENAVRAYLTAGRRYHISRFLWRFRGAVMDEQRIVWSHRGIADNTSEIVETVLEIAKFAKRLESPETDEEQDARAALEGLAEVDSRTMAEADGSGLASERRPAPKRRDPSMAKSYRGKRYKGKVRVRRRRGSDRVPTRAKPGLDVAEVAAALFGDEFDNVAVSRAFEERFVGKPVRWTGVLRSAERVTLDPVFGEEPFTRAIFTVFEPEVTGFTGRTVHAIVALVPAALDHLSGRGGEELVFGGTLVACDPFGRSLYVSGGKLEGLVR